MTRNDPKKFRATQTKHWERAVVESETSQLSAQLEEIAQTETIRNSIDLAVQRMRIPDGGKVLEAGCGTGTVFPALVAELGRGMVVGIDHSLSFLQQARVRANDGGFGDLVLLVQGDVQALPFPDAWFDAAHTERVLMHVADPSRVMQELRRVVKPGGWIVCVEPDLAGMRIDVNPTENGAAIVRAFCATLRSPDMGLRLHREMALAGLVERSVDTLTETQHELPEEVIDAWVDSAQIAVDRGWLSGEEAAETLDTLRAFGKRGVYMSYASMFVVAGRVPS